jgi:hypothetical protein
MPYGWAAAHALSLEKEVDKVLPYTITRTPDTGT